MTHGPEHHIEHAEHAAHAAHDDFNKRVTMSIAIVAAVLACITMLGHRAHNETLLLQGQALNLQTEASIKSTETANKWAYYQSKNMFNLESEIMLDLLKVIPVKDGSNGEFISIVGRYEDTVKYYSGDKDSRVTDRRKSKSEESKADGKLKKIEDEANQLAKEAKDILEKAKLKLEESHVVHAKANRFDYGELGLQFGVVLCSLAILTKGRGFWFAGLASSMVGLAVALTGQFGLFMGHH